MDADDALARSVADFARAELGEVAARSGPAKAFPEALLAKLDDLGLFGLALPDAAGGSGLGRVEQARIVAALAEVDASVALLVGLHAAGLRLREAAGEALGPADGEAAGAKLAVLAAGEAVTVPTAVPDDAVLFVRGARVYVDTQAVARAREGLPAGSGLFGLALGRAVPTAQSEAAATPVAAAAEVELALAAAALGVARGAFAAARIYAKERVQFQTPIVRFPVIGGKLVEAELAVAEVEAAVVAAAERLEHGDATRVSGALARATEVAESVASDAIQIHGGYGYTRDYPVERAFRDACALRAWNRAGR